MRPVFLSLGYAKHGMARPAAAVSRVRPVAILAHRKELRIGSRLVEFWGRLLLARYRGQHWPALSSAMEKQLKAAHEDDPKNAQFWRLVADWLSSQRSICVK